MAATKAAAQLQSDEAASKAYVSPVIKTGDRQLDRELADERNRKCVDCGGSEWPNTENGAKCRGWRGLVGRVGGPEGRKQTLHAHLAAPSYSFGCGLATAVAGPTNSSDAEL